MHIIYNKHPKGEARGLDLVSSPFIYALTIGLPTNRPNNPIGYNTHKIYLNFESTIARVEAHDGTTKHSLRDIFWELIVGCRARKLRQIFSWAWECQSRIEAWRQPFLVNFTPQIQWCCMFSDLRKAYAA
jgi:hypothetical protein